MVDSGRPVFMTGTIVVGTPTPTPTPSAGTGPAATALTLARTQRGSAVRGTIAVAQADSRLQVDVLAKRSALGGKGSTQTCVGRTVKASVRGTVSFSVALNSAAKRAVKRRGKLALTLKVTVTPPAGVPFTSTRAVTLRRA